MENSKAVYLIIFLVSVNKQVQNIYFFNRFNKQRQYGKHIRSIVPE